MPCFISPLIILVGVVALVRYYVTLHSAYCLSTRPPIA